MIFDISIGIVIGIIFGFIFSMHVMRWAVSDLRSKASAAIRNGRRAAEVEQNANAYVHKMNIENGRLLNEIQELQKEKNTFQLSTEIVENATDHVQKVNIENGTLINENRRLLNEIQRLKQEKESKPERFYNIDGSMWAIRPVCDDDRNES